MQARHFLISDAIFHCKKLKNPFQRFFSCDKICLMKAQSEAGFQLIRHFITSHYFTLYATSALIVVSFPPFLVCFSFSPLAPILHHVNRHQSLISFSVLLSCRSLLFNLSLSSVLYVSSNFVKDWRSKKSNFVVHVVVLLYHREWIWGWTKTEVSYLQSSLQRLEHCWAFIKYHLLINNYSSPKYSKTSVETLSPQRHSHPRTVTKSNHVF